MIEVDLGVVVLGSLADCLIPAILSGAASRIYLTVVGGSSSFRNVRPNGLTHCDGVLSKGGRMA